MGVLLEGLKIRRLMVTLFWILLTLVVGWVLFDIITTPGGNV
jgi:hypothetical protein